MDDTERLYSEFEETSVLKIVLVRGIFVSLLLAFGSKITQAQTPTSISGVFRHGSSVVISGSGFGTKSPAAPLVWDDCSSPAGTPIRSSDGGKWSGYVPNNDTGYGSGNGDPSWNMSYHSTGFRGVAGPHRFSRGYLAAPHALAWPGGNAYRGNNVAVWTTLPVVRDQTWIYAYHFQRADPNWKFCKDGAAGCSTNDDKWKDGRYQNKSDVYDGEGEGWQGPGDGIISCTDTHQQWQVYGDFLNAVYGAAHSNPCAGWMTVEVELFVTDKDTPRAFVLYDNGENRLSFSSGPDKGMELRGSNRTVQLGGFVRAQDPNNWRYLSDLYVDNTRAKILLCSRPSITIDSRGICYPQIPSAWSETSITVNVNQGDFADGSDAYLYVWNANGGFNSSGLKVIVGQPGDTSVPAPPRNLAAH